jgi:hypothetical protein
MSIYNPQVNIVSVLYKSACTFFECVSTSVCTRNEWDRRRWSDSVQSDRTFLENGFERAGHVGHRGGQIGNGSVLLGRHFRRHGIASHQRAEHAIDGENRALTLTVIVVVVIVGAIGAVAVVGLYFEDAGFADELLEYARDIRFHFRFSGGYFAENATISSGKFTTFGCWNLAR